MRYKNPPLIETNCQLSFLPENEWDDTFIGLFYGKVQGDYPVKRKIHEVALEVKGQDQVFHPFLASKNQFLAEDERSLIQLGKNTLVLNQLRPCGPWRLFQGVILENVKKYVLVVNPKGIRRISLRFINQFTVTDSPTSYLTIVPDSRPVMDDCLHFDLKLVGPGKSSGTKGGQLIVRVSCYPVPSGHSLTLYFHYFWEAEADWMGFGDAELTTWLAGAHLTIKRSFEDAITDYARQFFGLIPGGGDGSCSPI